MRAISEENHQKRINKSFSEGINNLLYYCKEIEGKYYLTEKEKKKFETNFSVNRNNCQKNKNKNNNLTNQIKGLKYILGNLEKNYFFISPYHQNLDVPFENEEKMTEEISKKIINLYQNKQFNECYHLWKKYDSKILIGTSIERSFDILQYLNKMRDRYENRTKIINKINSIKLEPYNNKIENKEEIQKEKNNLSFNDIYNFKFNENEHTFSKLKKQIANMKRIKKN